MNSLQDRKLNITEKLIMLTDEKVFDKVEKIILDSFKSQKPSGYTTDDLLRRAQEANKDIKDGSHYSQDDAELLSRDW